MREAAYTKKKVPGKNENFVCKSGKWENWIDSIFFLNVYKRCFIYIDECDVRMAKKG